MSLSGVLASVHDSTLYQQLSDTTAGGVCRLLIWPLCSQLNPTGDKEYPCGLEARDHLGGTFPTPHLQGSQRWPHPKSTECPHKVLVSELPRSQGQAPNNPSQDGTEVAQTAGLHGGSAEPTDVLQRHICGLVCPEDGKGIRERSLLCAREDTHGIAVS